ncbi:MAG: DUF523 domain-containing protein [Mariprofundaceae bacterium]|nr:DUF523 domain-containing protein [Mariprofundaceae bacterium]
MSACLLGEAVRYDGGDCLHHLNPQTQQQLKTWQQQGILLPLCPEVAGGLPVPRPAAEIQGDKVKTQAGIDVSIAFEAGAQRALALCQQYNIHIAILKQGSPSCGNTLINDGSFAKKKIAGQGKTAMLLQQHGVLVYNEMQLADVQKLLLKG